MKGCLLLAILFFKVSLRSCQSSYEAQEPPISSLEDSQSIKSHPQDNWKRYNDIDYDTFVGLMGRRSSGPNALFPNKRNMGDAFLGFMDRRSTQSRDLNLWRKEPEGRRKLFSNKGKLSWIFTEAIKAANLNMSIHQSTSSFS